MKASQSQIERALAAPGETRFFLLHGPDEAGSRALAARLAAAMGEAAERIVLTGAELRGDPARLADEAAALSMFGEGRWILVEQAGDESAEALQALVEAPAAGNPVAILAGALKPASQLLKAALAAPSGLAFASYPPSADQAGRQLVDLARERGLVVRTDVARRIAEACGGNRALAALELDKYALYLDAAPGAPKTLDHDALDAVGTGADEGDLARLVDSALGGDGPALAAEIARLGAEGKAGIALSRPVLKRLALLARLRAEVERGDSVAAVMASSGRGVFFKERDSVARQLGRWRAALLAKAVSRLVEAERQVMMPGGPGPIAAEAELLALCRQAARLR